MDWIFKLREQVPTFLENMRGKEKDGFFHYSLSGDLYSEKIRWGLGNTVFATKIYYTLGLLDSLAQSELGNIAGFIKAFQNKDGSISDPLIHKKSLLRNRLVSIKNFNFTNFFNQKVKMAETRQAFLALLLLHSKPDYPFTAIPYTVESLKEYINSLGWDRPWVAASRFSHLLFFYKINKEIFGVQSNRVNYLIDCGIDIINSLQSPDDGSWYKGRKVSLSQKINGAMKIITALNTVGRPMFNYPDKLIDLALQIPCDSNACDNFNIIYVLKYSNELTQEKYKYKEIRQFCQERLKVYKRYYFPENGGFSFYPDKSSSTYYGAKITKGLREPDIHATIMFLWGISIISQILRIDKEVGLKEVPA